MLRSLLLPFVTVLALGAPSAVAQTASFTTFGTACDDANAQFPAPAIGAVGLPQLGTTFTVTYQGANRAFFNFMTIPVLITGFQSQSLPVPALTPLMASDCTLYVTPDIVEFMQTVGPNYATQVSYMIPNNTSLLGATFFHQWATVEFRCLGLCNFNFALFSQGAQVTVGT